ncbi:MAG: glycosyl hydrolase family 5 [Alphaproteobacteria bacterium]|nr:MAG: glycosyl hydrolase family 5 [Alphaproteobacteria bacterium]
MNFRVKALAISSLILCAVPQALAQQHETLTPAGDVPVVVLAALDKITTQLSTIEIRQNQTVRFGTLDITLRYCRKNPPEEPPENVAFLEITDVGHNHQSRKVFSGWMFSSSPALSPLEHPVYDVWVKDCKTVSGPELTDRQ